MSILDFLQKSPSGDRADSGGAATGSSPDDNQLPIPGYDRISNKHLIAELSKHSQAELAAIDTYERSHKNRPAVFDKLRYLRGEEPLQGYDGLSVKEILTALEGGDRKTLQKTRLYERKFLRRPEVLDKVASGLREGRAASIHRNPPRVTA